MSKKQTSIAASGDGSNLWQSMLSEVAGRDELPDSQLLILGDPGVGKRSLLQAMHKTCINARNKFIQVETMGSSFSSIDSAFLYVRDLSEKDTLGTMMNVADENPSKLNVWILQDAEKAELL